MSAIFGILDLEGRAIDPTWIKSMQEDLSHRGPDGQGLYEEDSLAMGHLLLQVTPESVYDKSPYKEDGLVITANARLDEREVLMERLNIEPSERESITDPVLLLRSFRKYGKDFVKDIYGDFAFAIWDKEKKELFCARDQIGVRPFLYYFQNNRFVFCTELKAIVKLDFVNTEIDHLHLRDQAICIWNEQQKTTWKNIARLRPAHQLTINRHGISINEYWSPTYKRNKRFKKEEDSANALRKLLEKVIAGHTRVIGDIGVPLSGGLDSSTIACLTARKLKPEGKKITTASSVFEPGFADSDHPDEMEFINEILKQEQNIEPLFIYNTELDFFNGLAKAFNRHYAPANIFYYADEALYKKFQSKSIRRILSGCIGDFTVSNSSIYPFTYLLVSGRFAALRKLISVSKINLDQSLTAFIKNGILNELLPTPIQKAWNKFKGGVENPYNIDELPLKLNQKERLVLQKKVLDSFYIPNIYPKDIVENIRPADSDYFEEDWDCGSSYHQIEITYPLADRRILELLLQIPVEHFYAGGNKRGLIREAMIGILPDKIRNRKNKGAYSPGYPRIIKKDILEINAAMQKRNLSNAINALLDIDKLKIKLENLSESNNNNSFAYKIGSFFEFVMWANFSKNFEEKK